MVELWGQIFIRYIRVNFEVSTLIGPCCQDTSLILWVSDLSGGKLE